MNKEVQDKFCNFCGAKLEVKEYGHRFDTKTGKPCTYLICPERVRLQEEYNVKRGERRKKIEEMEIEFNKSLFNRIFGEFNENQVESITSIFDLHYFKNF
jgi:hypothetical protein